MNKVWVLDCTMSGKKTSNCLLISCNECLLLGLRRFTVGRDRTDPLQRHDWTLRLSGWHFMSLAVHTCKYKTEVSKTVTGHWTVFRWDIQFCWCKWWKYYWTPRFMLNPCYRPTFTIDIEALLQAQSSTLRLITGTLCVRADVYNHRDRDNAYEPTFRRI